MKNEDFGLDVGQANELKLAFRRFDWDNTLVKRLCETDVLGDALDILRGDAIAVPTKRVVELSADPELEEGDSVVKHLRQGKRSWNELRFVVMNPQDLQYTADYGREQVCQTGLNRRTMMPLFLRSQRPANICLRDYLLKNQHLIPFYESKPVLFWGTICRGRHCEYVPGMTRSFGKWEKYDRRINEPMKFGKRGRDFHEYGNPCVVLAPAPQFF